MQVVLISNFYNHHQASFCENMQLLTKKHFYFIATMEMPVEQKKLGYEEFFPDFVKLYYKGEKAQIESEKIINDADVVILGGASSKLVKKRLSQGKLTFKYSERRFKKNISWYHKLQMAYTMWKSYGIYENTYMLCASAYAASDEKKIHSFLDKCYKWGYFPETINYVDIDKIIALKKERTLLWVARFLEWKHPEEAIKLVYMLKSSGYQVTLFMIGIGPQESYVNTLIDRYDLRNEVSLLGAMSTKDVRRYMEQSQVMIFTSDQNEGWGAVLNEAMNSGCAVVASHVIGSVPFLIKDGVNGLIYKNGDIYDLFTKVTWIFNHDVERKELAKNAYLTIVDTWNGKIAAIRFLQLVKALQNKKDTPFEDGPCSKAEIIYDNWK